MQHVLQAGHLFKFRYSHTSPCSLLISVVQIKRRYVTGKIKLRTQLHLIINFSRVLQDLEGEVRCVTRKNIERWEKGINKRLTTVRFRIKK